VPFRCEEGRPKAVRNKVAGKGQQQNYWTEVVHVNNSDDRPDLSSEGAPDIEKTVNVNQKLISGHDTQMGLETRLTDRPIVGSNVSMTSTNSSQNLLFISVVWLYFLQ
jgi:hypothetical protein